jgi:hypothetical protein
LIERRQKIRAVTADMSNYIEVAPMP